MIFTFYSYKGGVGRSMALANVAEIFYQAGHKVLVVDWDLEAPGLDRFFFDDLSQIFDHPGLMDLLLEYKKEMAQEPEPDEDIELDDIKKYICEIYPENSNGGQLLFMPPGKRSGEHFQNFAQSVITFDWHDFYKNWDGEIYFEWLREQFESVADVILIDSRTGVTEMGGVCTYHLADTIVMFCAPNQQNIDGTYNMARNFSSQNLNKLRPDRPLNVVIVPSRVEDRSEIEVLEEFQHQFQDKFDHFLKMLPNVILKSYWDLKIPYMAFYSFNELVAVRKENRGKSKDMVNSFISLTSAIANFYDQYNLSEDFLKSIIFEQDKAVPVSMIHNLDLIIQPKFEKDEAELLKKDAESLEQIIENPDTGIKPVGENGLLERIGKALWKASGLNAEKVLDIIEDAEYEDESVRFLITGEQYQALPWELLFHENPDIGFVSRHSQCVVSRCVRYRHKQKPPDQSVPPLEILLFISSPEGLDPEKSRLDFEKEEELLFEALDDQLRKGLVRIDVSEDGALSTLISRLQQNRYHAVILSMHGTLAVNRKGEKEWGLLFEDGHTFRKSLVAGSELIEELEKLPKGHRPGLMVLSASRSAKAEESAKSISSITMQFHKRGFNQVLGMRLPVIDKAASVFNSELFRHLALGENVGRAVTMARSEVARGKWHDAKSEGKKYSYIEDPFAQWTLPVLMDRTADGSLLDSDTGADLMLQPVMPSVLIGDGSILVPNRASFIGRRYEIRHYLREFLETKKCFLMFTGPGGVGKTALAGFFTRLFMERQPNARVMGFQAPFSLDSMFEPLREQAFDGEEESSLKPAMETETDIRERIRRMLLSLSKRENRPFLLVLDNLDSLQDISDLEVRDEESQWFLKTVCRLPANIRVLMTCRYSLSELPEGLVSVCRVSDAPYGDILRRIDRLRWPGDISRDEKRRVFDVLGGNHRAVEWMGYLLSEKKPEAEELLKELERVETPPNTADGALEVVKEAMRQNILFSAVRNQLSEGQDHLLRACSLYRVPVTEDGLLLVDTDIENHGENRRRLIDYTLLSVSRNPVLELDYFIVPSVVKSLIGDSGFDKDELTSVHEKMGRYHRFQGKHVSRGWGEYLEAIYHLRLAGNHSAADELAEVVAGFYYRISNFAEANRLSEEIVEREYPPAPWWALTRYGMCQRILGFPDKALHSYERALPVSPTVKDKGATLNNIGQIYRARGGYDTALKYLEQSLKIDQEIGDKQGQGATLNNISQIYDARGDYNTALKYLEQSLTIRQEIEDKSGEGRALNNIGQILQARGDYDTALKYLVQSLNITQEIGDKSGQGRTLNNISQIFKARGDYDTALKYLVQSLNITQEIGDKSGQGGCLNNISQIFKARGDYDTALKYLKQSLMIRQEIGDKSGMSGTLYNMGHIAFQADDLEKAMTLWSESLSIAMEIKYAIVIFHVAGQMGAIYAQTDDKEEARKLLSLAVQVGKQAGFPNVNEFEEILEKI